MSRNTVDAGRLKIQAPEFGFDVEDGGIELYNTLHNIFTFIGDNTIVRWYSFTLNANGFTGDTVVLRHNYDTPLAKLKITFTQDGNILSSSQVQSLLAVTSANNDTITVQNLSNNNIYLHCYIGATKGRITADDFDADYYDQIVERTKAQVVANKSLQNLRLLSQTPETNLPSNAIGIANVDNKLTTYFTRDAKNTALSIAHNVDLFTHRNFIKNAKAEYLLNTDILTGPDANQIAFASSNIVVDNTAFVFVPKSTRTDDTYIRFLVRSIDPFYSDKTLAFACKTYTTVANKYRIKIVNITDNVTVAGTEQIVDSGYRIIRFDVPSYLNPAKTYAVQIDQLTDGATGELYLNDLFLGDLLTFSSGSGSSGGSAAQDDSLVLPNGVKIRIRNPYSAKTSQAKIQLSAYGSDLAQIANDYKAAGYHAVVFTPTDSLPTLPNVNGIIVSSGSKYTYDFASVYQFFGSTIKDNSITDIVNATNKYNEQAIAAVDVESIETHLIADNNFTTGSLQLDIATMHKLAQSGNWIYTFDNYDGVDSSRFNKRWIQAFVNDTTSESEIKASVKSGNCYLTTGVMLTSIELVNKKIISITANEQCTFLVYADGKLVQQTTAATIQYDISDFSASYYIIQAVNANNQFAWTQPFYIERSDRQSSINLQPINKNRSFTHPSIFHTNEIDISANFLPGEQCQIFPFWFYSLSTGATKLRIENKSELKITAPSSSVTQLVLLNRALVDCSNKTFSACAEFRKTTSFTNGAIELVIIATYADNTSTIAAKTITAQELTANYKQFTVHLTTAKSKRIKHIECGLRFASGNLPNANAIIYVRNVCLYQAFVVNKFAEFDYPTYDKQIPLGKNLFLNASFEYRPIQDTRDLSLQNHPLAIWTTVPFCYGFTKPNNSRVVITTPSPGVFSSVHENVNPGTFGNGYYNAIAARLARLFETQDLLYYRARHSLTGASSGVLNYNIACSVVFKHNSNAVDGLSRGSNYTSSLSYNIEFADDKFEFSVPIFLLRKAFDSLWRGFGIELYLRLSNPITQNITSIYADAVQYIFDNYYYLPRYISLDEGRREAALLYENNLPNSQKTWTTGTTANGSIQATYTIAIRTGNSSIYVATNNFFESEKHAEMPAGFSFFATDRGIVNQVREHTPGNFVARSASLSYLHRNGHCEIYCTTSNVSVISFNWEYDRC